jgi:hypothetical protein
MLLLVVDLPKLVSVIDGENYISPFALLNLWKATTGFNISPSVKNKLSSWLCLQVQTVTVNTEFLLSRTYFYAFRQ